MNLKPLHLYFFMGQSMMRRMFLIMSLLFLALPPLLAQTVTTDKDDYQPGQYVIVTGTGWEPGETVLLDFHETPQVCSTDSHERSTVAKEDGSIYYDQFLINTWHLGVAFELTATGQTSGSIAKAFFTDANIQYQATGVPTGTEITVFHDYEAQQGSQTVGTSTTFEVKSTPHSGTAFKNGSTVRFKFISSVRAAGIDYILNEVNAVSFTGGGANTNPFPLSNSTVAEYDYQFSTNNNIRLTANYHPSAPTITSISPATIQAGGPDFTLVVTGTNFLPASVVRVNGSDRPTSRESATQLTVTITAAEIASVGSHLITVFTPAPGGGTSDAVTLVVTKANQTITFQEIGGKTYGDEAFELNASASSGLSVSYTSSDQSVAKVSGNTVTIVGAGTTTISASQPGNNTYNPATTVEQTLTVAKAPLAAAANNASREYGDPNPSFTGTITGIKYDDEITATYSTSASSTSAIGAYAIVPTLSGDALANYEKPHITNGALSITPALLTITAADASRMYGEENPSFTGSYAGQKNGETFVISGSAEANANSAVATYAIVPSVEGETLGNYTVNKVNGTLTVTKATLVAKANDATKVYGEANPPLSGQIVSGAVAGDSFTLTATADATSGSPVGDYAITLNVDGPKITNYEVETQDGTLTITPRPVTVAANALSKVYGEADPTLTYTITDGNVVNGDSFSGSLERESGENVRAYAIGKGTLSLGDNYNLSFEEAQFTINPKQITVRLSAEDKVYDGSEQATASGFIAAYELVGSDQVEVTVRNAAFSDKNVGTAKPVTADVSITHGNYTLSSATASTTASITAKPIVGTFTAQSKVYDGTTAATVTDLALLGIIAGDDIQLTGGEARFADKNANTGKTVTLVGAALSGKDKDNYTLASVEQALADITQRPASVTPKAVTKVYGTPDPVLTGTLEGFVEADEITADFLRPLGEWVGKYDITSILRPKEALRNYEITYNEAFLEITPAELVVTAHNASRKYGDANPEFTGSVSGIVGYDEIEISYTSKATPESVVGSYAITPELSGDALVNYTVKAANGILTIERAALSLQVNDKTRKYGDENPAFDGTLTGLKNSDPITPSYRTEADESTNVGEYAITGSLLDPNKKLGNYEVSITDGVLSIQPASAQIHLSGLSKVYNGQAQGVEVATVPEGLAVNITYNSAAVAPTKADSYSVVAKLANSNYTAPDATGTLVIAQKELTADLSNAGKVYDGTTAAPGTTATLTGVVTGDEVTAHVSEAIFSSANAGERTVSATVTLQGSDAANYVLKQVNATTSTISRAPLRITAPSMSKYCGQADPLTGYTCTVTGAVNQEQILTSYTVAGTEVIPASTDAKLVNYDLTLVKGTLTINGLTLDASAASNPRSVNEDVIINISVKDGETAIGGVEVVLHIEGLQSKTAVSNANGIATFNFNRLPAKVYSVQAVAGGSACAASQVVYLPIYDPDGGFVTGGGWINSPKDALAADTEATGKANFGFVAKYKKGKNEVDGNTEFQFQNGNLNFKSSSHTAATLVISGAKATYKGKGFINGGGMEYDFMVVATDGDINGGGGYDKFRIKIWNGGDVVYDNARGAADNAELGDAAKLGGGSIVIHENKSLNGGSGTKKLAAVVTPEQLSASFLNYPNPYTDRTTITFSVEKDEQFALEVYDVKGARVRKTEEGMAEAGKVYEFEFSANSLPEGVYFARLTTASGVKTIKMVLKK